MYDIYNAEVTILGVGAEAGCLGVQIARVAVIDGPLAGAAYTLVRGASGAYEVGSQAGDLPLTIRDLDVPGSWDPTIADRLAVEAFIASVEEAIDLGLDEGRTLVA